MDCYRKGLEGRQAEFAIKKYKSSLVESSDTLNGRQAREVIQHKLAYDRSAKWLYKQRLPPLHRLIFNRDTLHSEQLFR